MHIEFESIKYPYSGDTSPYTHEVMVKGLEDTSLDWSIGYAREDDDGWYFKAHYVYRHRLSDLESVRERTSNTFEMPEIRRRTRAD